MQIQTLFRILNEHHEDDYISIEDKDQFQQFIIHSDATTIHINKDAIDEIIQALRIIKANHQLCKEELEHQKKISK